MNSTFGPSVSGEELCNKQFRTKSRNGKFRLGHGVHLVPRKCIRDVSANSEKPCWPGLHSLGFPRFLRLEFLSPSPKADSNLCGAPSLHSAHLGLGSDLTLGFLAGLGTHVLCSVVQSCLTLCDPMDCSPPGSSVNGISQARIPEWVAISFSRASSQHRDRNNVSCISCIFCINSRFFTTESPGKPKVSQFSSVQSLSRVLLFATPWTAAHRASLSITNSQSLLKCPLSQ